MSCGQPVAEPWQWSADFGAPTASCVLALPPPAGDSSFPRVDGFKAGFTYSNSGETWVEVRANICGTCMPCLQSGSATTKGPPARCGGGCLEVRRSRPPLSARRARAERAPLWAVLPQVGRDRIYTPGPDDVGAILKFECTAYDAGALQRCVRQRQLEPGARCWGSSPCLRGLLEVPPPGTAGALFVLSSLRSGKACAAESRVPLHRHALRARRLQPLPTLKLGRRSPSSRRASGPVSEHSTAQCSAAC